MRLVVGGSGGGRGGPRHVWRGGGRCWAIEAPAGIGAGVYAAGGGFRAGVYPARAALTGMWTYRHAALLFPVCFPLCCVGSAASDGQPAAGLASPPKAGPPSEGATGGGAASSGGGGSGKRGGGGGGQDFERRSDFERQVTTIRQQVERVRANLAKAEQYVFACTWGGWGGWGGDRSGVHAPAGRAGGGALDAA